MQHKPIKVSTVNMFVGTPPALRGVSEMIHQHSFLEQPVATRHIEDQARQFIRDRLVQEFRRVSKGKIKFIL
jgi:UDP-galactopyranose mutase